MSVTRFLLKFPSKTDRERLSALTAALNAKRTGPGKPLTDSDVVRWLIERECEREDIPKPSA